MHGMCVPIGEEDLVLTPVVEAGCVRSLWFGVQLPRQVAPQAGVEGLTLEITLRLHLQHGAHQGGAEGGAEGGASSRVVSQEESLLRLSVRGEEAQHAGDDRAWRLSRLRWLDSNLGKADAGGEAGGGAGSALPPPFTPVREVKATEAVEAAEAVEGRRARRGSRGGGGRGGGGRAAAPWLSFEARMGRVAVNRQGLPLQLWAVGAAAGAAGGEAASPLLSSPVRLTLRPPGQPSGDTEEDAAQRSLARAVGKARRGLARRAQGGAWRVVRAAYVTSRSDEHVAWAAHLQGRGGRGGATGAGAEGLEVGLEVACEWWFDASLVCAATLRRNAQGHTATEGSEGSVGSEGSSGSVANVGSIELSVPVREAAAEYAMGFGWLAQRRATLEAMCAV